MRAGSCNRCVLPAEWSRWGSRALFCMCPPAGPQALRGWHAHQPPPLHRGLMHGGLVECRVKPAVSNTTPFKRFSARHSRLGRAGQRMQLAHHTPPEPTDAATCIAVSRKHRIYERTAVPGLPQCTCRCTCLLKRPRGRLYALLRGRCVHATLWRHLRSHQTHIRIMATVPSAHVQVSLHLQAAVKERIYM